MCAIAERCGKYGTGLCKDLKILDPAKQTLAHDCRINTLSRTFPCYQLSRALWIIAAARVEWLKYVSGMPTTRGPHEVNETKPLWTPGLWHLKCQVTNPYPYFLAAHVLPKSLKYYKYSKSKRNSGAETELIFVHGVWSHLLELIWVGKTHLE